MNLKPDSNLQNSSRRDFLKLAAITTGSLLTQCNKQTLPPDIPRSYPSAPQGISSQLQTQIEHTITQINQFADSQISSHLTPALEDLQNFDFSGSGVQGSKEYFYELATQTLFSKQLDTLEIPAFISKTSQILRHLELITQNSHNIPKEFHSAYLYITAIETINQYYQGNMQRAFTNQLEPQIVTKYIYSFTQKRAYQTVDIPKMEPRTYWSHLSANGAIPKRYFYNQFEANQIQIPNTPFQTTESFLRACKRRPDRFQNGLLYPSLMLG